MNGEHIAIDFRFSHEFVSCGANTYTDIPTGLRSDIAVILVVSGHSCFQGRI